MPCWQRSHNSRPGARVPTACMRTRSRSGPPTTARRARRRLGQQLGPRGCAGAGAQACRRGAYPAICVAGRRMAGARVGRCRVGRPRLLAACVQRRSCGGRPQQPGSHAAADRVSVGAGQPARAAGHGGPGAVRAPKPRPSRPAAPGAAAAARGGPACGGSRRERTHGRRLRSAQRGARRWRWGGRAQQPDAVGSRLRHTR